MPDAHHGPDREPVDDLARRARQLIDLRSTVTTASRELLRPVLVTYACARDALGRCGSPLPRQRRQTSATT